MGMHLGDAAVVWQRPQAGMFLWVRLTKPPKDIAALLELMNEHGVAVLPGEFCKSGAPRSSGPPVTGLPTTKKRRRLEEAPCTDDTLVGVPCDGSLPASPAASAEVGQDNSDGSCPFVRLSFVLGEEHYAEA